MSSTATDEDLVDRWIELDDSISVPEQSLEQMLADKVLDLDDELLSASEDDQSLTTAPRLVRPMSPVSYTLHSPLQLTNLESVSYQLRTHCGQTVGGHSTALSVSNAYVAVGTSRGLVLIFYRETQRLHKSIMADGYPVSCLSFNSSATYLAIGYSSGLIRLFSVPSGRKVDESGDLIQPGRGILQILFTTRSKNLICLDSGGSVYELKISGKIRSRRTRCVFSGCHGEVVYIKMLDNDRILALLSLKKVFLLKLGEMRLIHTAAFHGPASAPPLIDWQTINVNATIRSDSKTTAFCVGRGSKVEFFYLDFSNLDCKVVRYQMLSLNFDLINLKWIEPYHLLVVDVNENVHLIDVVLGEVAMEDIRDMQLTYGTADFKGLSTGGNVSAAMDYLAVSVCYQSIRRFGNIIYILGQFSLHTITVNDLIAQLDSFIDRGEVVPAVLFTLDVYLGKTVNKIRCADSKHLVSRISNLVQSLLILTTSGLENGKVAQLIDHYKKHIQLLVRVCVTTSRFDLLYDTVYTCLEKDVLSKKIFFDSIDEVVLDGRLDNPPPILVSDYLHHLMAEGNLSQFEAAVVRIPFDKQDIHFVMTTCKANRLYDGVIYIYNKAMSDYIRPLEEMFENVAEFADCEVFSDCEIAQGNKLLLYIQCCLSSRAYPIGFLPENIADALPLQVYRCLISYKGKDGTSTSETYPYLRLLIKFDAHQFFNVIFTCSDCGLFNSEEGRLQRLVEIIYQIISSLDRNVVLFMNFFTLITHLLQKKAILATLDMINELIEVALSFDGSCLRVEEAERCVVEVMRIVCNLDEMKILRLAKKLPHLQVCSHIYTNRREFISLLECYLSDKANAELIFPLTKTLLLELNGVELSKISSFISKSLQRFAKINLHQTAELILDHFMDWLREETVEDREILLYYYCFLARRDRGYHTLTGSEERDEQLLALAIEGLVAHNLFEDMDLAVSEFLHYWLSLASRTDRCLNYTVEHSLIKSSVLLLEARELIAGAFELLDSELEKAWMKDEVLTSKCICETIRLANLHHKEARKGNWLFRILHRILSLPESKLQEESAMMVILNDVIAALLESGSSDAEHLVDVLFTHPAFRCATYAKFGKLITSIFASCRYEAILLKETVKCIEQEVIQMLISLVNRSTRRTACLITSSVCISCGKSLNKSSYLHRCGHIVHMACDSGNSTQSCPCQTNTFRPVNFEDHFDRSSSHLIRKPERTDIFAEESLRLSLGPERSKL